MRSIKPPTLTASEIAATIDLTVREFRKLVAAGRFPPPDDHRGKADLWRASTVVAFLDGSWWPNHKHIARD
jgi:hypothetical protein